ncbi:hypothetical protein [Alistipes senegalensis]|uniref:hypothetical protein n=1 Tax=Alistipes senegalensis TaxID=1288121 RepID=UPI00242F4FD2|nr:hypothetical protein [Alistipes senegalensis]
MKLASFDIFDTVLVRKCGHPRNIFYLSAKKLYPDTASRREDFFLWRCRAEQEAVSRIRSKNPTLADIYDDSALAGFSEYSPEELMFAEKQTEKENLVVNPTVKALIEQKRDEGFRICFISDMYLDSRFLADILRASGCLQEDEPIFVSCEHAAGKSEGKLFDTVRQAFRPATWQHFGDNLHSDVKIPRKKGITATPVDTRFTPIEQHLSVCSKAMREVCELSILAGLSRCARILSGNDPFISIAADYIAPAYIPYVQFIFRQAQSDGVKQLYFLSRDSYILLKSAQQLLPEYSGIRLHYLFLSRKSLMLPYLAEVSKTTFLEALDQKTVLRKRVSSLLGLLSTDAQELAASGITFAYDKITSREQADDFLSKIFESDYTPVLQKRAKERHRMLLEYLRQEGVLNGEKSAMVDVGWLGTSRLMLNAILKQSGHAPVAFYYYGIRGDILHTQYGDYCSYFHAGQLSTEATALIENYFSASPYPTTIGYEQNGEQRICPVFPEGEVKADTRITRANVDTIEWISRAVSEMGFVSENALFIWATTVLDAISTLKDRINLMPFTRTDDFDNASFVRKLSMKELFTLLCTGKQITAFDKASLQLTCGYRLSSHLWKIRNKTGKIRRILYLKYVKAR